MKIAICLPIHSGAHPKFVGSLSRMLVTSARAKIRTEQGSVTPEIETFIVSTSSVGYSRRKIARTALGWGAHWLLWLDADQTFPADTLNRLLAHQKYLVGANYRRRAAPHKILPTASKRLASGKKVLAYPEGSDLEEVESLGLGVCLTHSSVFEKIGEPFFFEEMETDGLHAVGEDVFFFRKALAAGFKVFSDNKLSREVGHMSELELKFP